MRRRMREAYRLNRHLLTEETPVDIAFIYVADKLTAYNLSVKSITKILGRISATVAEHKSDNI